MRVINMSKKTTQSVTSYFFEDLVDDYGESVHKFCRSLTYSKEDADDLLQETFLKVLEQLPKASTFENPQSFLFSTALYIWKSWKRKYARRNRLAPVEPLSDLSQDIVSSGISVEDSVLDEEKYRVVRQLVDSLPEKFKIPTLLYYTLEMSAPEIGEILALPPGTVYSRLHKAKNLIKKGLIAVGYEE